MEILNKPIPFSLIEASSAIERQEKQEASNLKSQPKMGEPPTHRDKKGECTQGTSSPESA